VLTAVQPRSRFGELALDGKRVKAFIEKPVLPRWINGGFMALDRRAVAACVNAALLDHGAMFVHWPMRELVDVGRVWVHKHRGFWACVDTQKDLQDLQSAHDRGEWKWRA
jgi:glucose-1-phosphate cytidylyltransferase